MLSVREKFLQRLRLFTSTAPFLCLYFIIVVVGVILVCWCVFTENYMALMTMTFTIDDIHLYDFWHTTVLIPHKKANTNYIIIITRHDKQLQTLRWNKWSTNGSEQKKGEIREARMKRGNQNSANRKYSFIVRFNYIQCYRVNGVRLASIRFHRQEKNTTRRQTKSIQFPYYTLKMLYCCRFWFRWLCISCWMPIKTTSLSPGEKQLSKQPDRKAKQANATQSLRWQRSSRYI